jgi:hypothetical protein
MPNIAKRALKATQGLGYGFFAVATYPSASACRMARIATEHSPASEHFVQSVTVVEQQMQHAVDFLMGKSKHKFQRARGHHPVEEVENGPGLVL